MQLTGILFLYIFLPVFMGIYSITSPKRRPALIAAANILFIAAADWRGLIFFAVIFLSAYFSAIIIYNARSDPKKSGRRKALLAVNAVINAAVFILFSHMSQLPENPLSSLSLFGAVSIPLHAISYLADVYRGSCEVQTGITPLAAYISFFPSANFGPIMKYKNFHKSFTAPQISHEKLAEGIRLYVMGLAENLLVAEPLRNTWISLTRTSYENIKGMSVWLSILIFCLTFSTLVMSTLHMGQGVALMLGFPVRQCHKRMIFRGSVKEYAKEVNIPLYRWFEDYVYKPLSANGAAPAKLGALIVASEAAMLWYAVGTGWAVAGAATAVIIAIEAALGGRLGKIPNALRRLISAAIMISIGAIVCSGSLTENHSFLEATTPNQAGLQNDFQSYLISTSAPLIIAGLLIMSGILKKPIKRTGINWYRAALPIIELVLILLCTATMIAGK